jgi:hypothetical protein
VQVLIISVCIAALPASAAAAASADGWRMRSCNAHGKQCEVELKGDILCPTYKGGPYS